MLCVGFQPEGSAPGGRFQNASGFGSVSSYLKDGKRIFVKYSFYEVRASGTVQEKPYGIHTIGSV
jgi:hypothetical protein